MPLLDQQAFVRLPGAGDFAAYKNREHRFLNGRNLFVVPRRVVIRRFNIADRQMSLAYRFELVRDWILSDYKEGVGYTWLLRFLLRKLCLFGELNAYEQNFLSLGENMVFTKDRSIKNLAVDFAKRAGEVVAFHYDGVTVAQLVDVENRPIVVNGDVYLTSQRMVFSDALQLFFLFNRDVMETVTKPDALIVSTRNGLTFRILCEAPSVLLAAFNKISG